MAQYLPPNDSFDTNGHPIGRAPALWVRLRPWTSMPNHGSGGTEFAEAVPSPEGHISTAYFTVGGPLDARISGRRAVHVSTDASFPAPYLGMHAFRSVLTEDVDVRMTVSGVYNVTIGGNAPKGVALHSGVGARIRNGSQVNLGNPNTERVDSCDGYWFFRLADDSALLDGYKYVLLRTVSGTVTRIAESPSGSGNFFPHSEITLAPTTVLRMTCETVAGNVEIHCYATVYGGGGVPAEQEVLTFTDSSGSKITGTGRVGFATSVEASNITGAKPVYHARAVTYVEALDPSDDSLLFRDEWVRSKYDAALTVYANVNSYSGRSLQSGWVCDLFSTDSLLVTGDYADGFQRLTANDRAKSTPNAVTTGSAGVLAIISQRPEDDAVNQHRQVTITFPTDATAPDVSRYGGVIIRESGSDPETSVWVGAGYAILIRRDDSAAEWYAELRRYRGGSYALIAQIPHPTFALSLDTAYTLSLEAVNVGDGPGNVTNEVRLKAYLDGTQMVLQALPIPPAGITVQGDGTVYDAATTRVTSGLGAGILVDGSGNNKTIQFDAWTEVGDLPPTSTEEDSQESIAFLPETTGATGTLSLPLSWSVREMDDDEPREAIFEADYRWASVRTHAARRAWEVTAGPCTRATADTLLAFFDSHKGVEVPFTWTDPEGVARTVAFVDFRLAVGLRAPTVSDFTFVLEERRGH